MRYGLIGSTGRMGREIKEVFAQHELVLEISEEGRNETGVPEVIVDFSNRDVLPTTLGICREFRSGLVIGTTALEDNDLASLKELSKSYPVVQSYNFSVGINILRILLRESREFFKGMDAEMIEVHHNKKKDMPSGTALILKESLGMDIPIHSVRTGGVPGDHEIVFASEGEVIKISHRAISRKVFALGTLRAAEFCRTVKSGLYSFEEVLRWTQKR